MPRFWSIKQTRLHLFCPLNTPLNYSRQAKHLKSTGSPLVLALLFFKNMSRTPRFASKAILSIGNPTMCSYPISVDIAGLEADPNLQVFSQPGFNMGYLAYNVTHKPLNDVRVRRALDM